MISPYFNETLGINNESVNNLQDAFQIYSNIKKSNLLLKVI